MPEIGEVARAVHFLNAHLANKRLTEVLAEDDCNVFGKVGTTGAAVVSSLTNKTVLSAHQQGKYFWLVMSSPPHPLMHFGMTGWIKFNHVDSSYYNPEKPNQDDAQWPPRFWKFILKTEDGVEVAFVDSRRFARVRLMDCTADELRKVEPLCKNGPDPVRDRELLTCEWLKERIVKKRVPVKAWMLDQANISGVGNWVADEILFQASIHPEQYTDSLKDAQLVRLWEGLMHVCGTAVEVLADSSRFPDGWLMKHRWGKGKKEASRLPDGRRIKFVTVGGRTSAIVPSKQLKTGPVAGDVKKEDLAKVKEEEVVQGEGRGEAETKVEGEQDGDSQEVIDIYDDDEDDVKGEEKKVREKQPAGRSRKRSPPSRDAKKKSSGAKETAASATRKRTKQEAAQRESKKAKRRERTANRRSEANRSARVPKQKEEATAVAAAAANWSKKRKAANELTPVSSKKKSKEATPKTTIKQPKSEPVVKQEIQIKVEGTRRSPRVKREPDNYT